MSFFRMCRIRYLSFLTASLMLVLMVPGCSKRPDGVLSEKKMVAVMSDLQIADSYSEMEYSGSDLSEFRYNLGESVLASHGVTREELDSTLSWYGRNLDDFTNLYDKVDKRIIAKRKEMLKDADTGNVDMEQGDILWPYSKNGVLSKLGDTDGWIVSIPNPELEKGDIIEWTMHLPLSSQLYGVLGVEYTDGSGESVNTNFTGRNSIDLSIQTDTGKVVDRIFGTLRLKEPLVSSIFVDSIKMRRLPYDSLEYRKYRNQRRFGVPVRKMTVKKTETDSVKVANTDSIRHDALPTVHDAPAERTPSHTPVRPGMSPSLDRATPQKARSIETVRSSVNNKPKPKQPVRRKK